MTAEKTFSRTPGDEALQEIACPLCRASRETPYWECGSHRYVRCRECGLIYQNPQPIEQDLLKRYDQSYFKYEEENERNFFNLMKLGLRDVRFDCIEESFVPPRRFLDVGCATGMLIAWMQERGWHTQGVEVCRPAAEYGMQARKVSIHIGTLESADFPDQSFDVVHSSHLIEHLTDPNRYVATVHRIVRPGGYFICVTPNVAGLQARLLRADWRSAIADHLVLFNTVTLARLLTENGFSIIDSKTWGGIARGLVPHPIKVPIDKAAKLFGFGDVMIFLAQRDN